jgi:hypothetical protein
VRPAGASRDVTTRPSPHQRLPAPASRVIPTLSTGIRRSGRPEPLP